MSVTVIYSAPKVNPKANNDAMQSDKRAVEASETGDSFSDSLNEELNAVKNEPETSNQNNVSDKSELQDESVGQENSALARDVLPLSFAETKLQEINLDETISALNDIVAQLGDDQASLLELENTDLLEGHFPLQNAQAQLESKDGKDGKFGLNMAQQALLKAGTKQKLINQAQL
jgi:hypothetical protein